MTTTEYHPAPPAPDQDIRDKYVGSRALITLGKLNVYVTILDVRNRYGNLDTKITPMNGSGTTWVEARRLRNVGA